MFQKEVAERIVAAPAPRLTAARRLRRSGDRGPSIAMNVNRSAFVPPPKVMSAVVHIVPVDARKASIQQ